MATLGRWIMRSACEQAAHWRARTPNGSPHVSINVSPMQLLRTDVVADLRAILEDTGVMPDGVILELTETVIMDDFEAVTELLKELKQLGVGLAIDDFGTGYCSLEYLRHFPIDYLKIARSFLTDLDGPAADPSLTRGIVDLGSNFGLTTIAEGVEHAHQRERLLELGCELGQGFLFARPRLPEQLEPTILNGSRLALADGQ